MKVNSINKYMTTSVSFNANSKNNKQTVPYSQQQPAVNFEESIARKADSLNANPITSLGYKLYRTFRIISEHEPSAVATQQNLNVVA